MYCYRLRVITTNERIGGAHQFAQGTGWFVEHVDQTLVVTAFHVVGDRQAHQWLHEDQSCGHDIGYVLDVGKATQPVRPVCFDAEADIALLECTTNPRNVRVLRLTDEIAVWARWRAEGFPAIVGDEDITPGGTVRAVDESKADHALDLYVEEGTNMDWSGISGSAVLVEGDLVVGVVTEQKDLVNHVCGATVTPLRRLLGRYEACQKLSRLLLKSSLRAKDLIRLERIATGGAGSPAQRKAIVARLREAALRGGVDVLNLLLGNIAKILPEGDVAAIHTALREPSPLRRIEAQSARVFPPAWTDAIPSSSLALRPASVFDNLLIHHTARFGGRKEILRWIEDFVGGPDGYRLIIADAGMGKTAVMAYLTTSPPGGSRLLYHFFNKVFVRSALDDGSFLRNIILQIDSDDGVANIPNAQLLSLQARFNRLLEALAPQRVLLILDGLDEALFNPGVYLPHSLPSGLHVILTARPVLDRNWLQFLKLPDVIQWDLPVLSDEDIIAVLKKAGNKASALCEHKEYLNEIVRVSERDPFYLRYLAEDLAKGTISVGDLTRRPSGLDPYLDDWWRDVVAGSAGAESVSGVLATMTVAFGPVPRQDLLALYPNLPVESVERLGRWVVGDDPDGYSMCHKRFTDYVARKIGHVQCHSAHQRLMDYCRQWAATGSVYALRHYPNHLGNLKLYEELCGLIENPDWCEKKRAFDPSGSALIVDIDQTLVEAEQRQDIPRVIAYSLLLAFLSKEVSPQIIEAMIRLGRREQAVRYAQLIKDPCKLLMMLRRMLETLAQMKDIDSARALLQQIQDLAEAQDKSLANYRGPTLPSIKQSLKRLKKMNLREKAAKFSDLAAFPFYNIPPDALEKLETLDLRAVILSPPEKALKLLEFASALRQLMEVSLRDAGFPRFNTLDPEPRADFLSLSLKMLATGMADNVLEDIRDLIRSGFGVALAHIGETRRALAVATAIKDPLARLDIMSLAAAALAPKVGFAQTLRQSMSTGQIWGAETQTESLAQVLVTNKETVSCILDIWEQLANIDDPNRYTGAIAERISILARMAKSLTDIARLDEAKLALAKAMLMVKDPRFLEELFEIFTGKDPSALVKALDTVIDGVIWANMGQVNEASRRVTSQYLELARHHTTLASSGSTDRERTENDERDYVETLCVLASALFRVGDQTGAMDALDRAQCVINEKIRSQRLFADALGSVARTLARAGAIDQADRTLSRALDAMEKQHNEQECGRSRDKFLEEWINILIKSAKIEEASRLADNIADEAMRTSILKRAGLAADSHTGTVSSDGSEAVLASRRALELIRQGNERAGDTAIKQSIASAESLNSEVDRLETLDAIVVTLSDGGHGQKIEELCKLTDDVSTRAFLSCALLRAATGSAQSDEDFVRLLDLAFESFLKVDAELYHLPLCTLMVEQTVRRSNKGAALRQHMGAMGDTLADQLEMKGISLLVTLQSRDGEIGFVRKLNVMRMAVGLKAFPEGVIRQVLEMNSLDIWRWFKAQAKKPPKSKRSGPTITALCESLKTLRYSSADIVWQKIADSVALLYETRLINDTWRRLQVVESVSATISG